MHNDLKNRKSPPEQADRAWAGFFGEDAGRHIAEYAFQSGFLFPLLVQKNPAASDPAAERRPKFPPGIETEPRTVRTVSGRGVKRAAKPRTF